MTDPDPDWMDLNEAVKHIMKATGKTRRQAEAALLQEMKKGTVQTRGQRIGPGGEDLGVHDIDPEIYQDAELK